MVSVVINTLNEEKNIERCLSSVAWADEIVVVDMESTDKTRSLAQKFTDKIYSHPLTGFVEPARNFAVKKANNDWILILDADEVIPGRLAQTLKILSEKGEYDFFRIPRKNIIFNRWILHGGWWPDYQIRFFKKGKVTWDRKIHGVPLTRGRGLDLIAEEENAIIHYNYSSIGQFVERLNRYTEVEAQQLVSEGYKFLWPDLFAKPTGEFSSRFFLREGYKDGLHGFALSLLQAFSFFVTYLKVWEKEGFWQAEEKNLLDAVKKEFKLIGQQFNFWYFREKEKNVNIFQKIIYKIYKRMGK